MVAQASCLWGQWASRPLLLIRDQARCLISPQAGCLCYGASVVGHGRIRMRAGSLPPVELRGNSGDNFFDADGFHAAEIDGAFAKETGTALDLMPKNIVTKSQRPGQARLSRSKNGDNRNSDERGQV